MSTIFEYDHVYSDAAAGKPFYRLRMVIREELEKFSDIVCGELKGNEVTGLEKVSSVIGEQVQVSVMSGRKQTILLQLFNEQGKLVRSKKIEGNAGLNLIELDNVQQLAAGAYFLQLKTGGHISSRKIIKQ